MNTTVLILIDIYTNFSCCEMMTNSRMATKDKAPKTSKAITGNLETEGQKSLTLGAFRMLNILKLHR